MRFPLQHLSRRKELRNEIQPTSVNSQCAARTCNSSSLRRAASPRRVSRGPGGRPRRAAPVSRRVAGESLARCAAQRETRNESARRRGTRVSVAPCRPADGEDETRGETARRAVQLRPGSHRLRHALCVMSTASRTWRSSRIRLGDDTISRPCHSSCGRRGSNHPV